MGWLFLFAIVFLMVFLVLNSRRTRLAAVAVFAFISAVVGIYLLDHRRGGETGRPAGR